MFKNPSLKILWTPLWTATFALLFGNLSMALTSDQLSMVLSKPAGRWGKLDQKGGIIYDTTILNNFYQNRQYEPLWISKNEINPKLQIVRGLFMKSARHGFRSEQFWTVPMEEFYNYMGESNDFGMNELDFELATSEALIRYIQWISIGQVDPSVVDDDIKLQRKNFGPPELEQIKKILEGEITALETNIESFEPQNSLYQFLKTQLENTENKENIQNTQIKFTNEQLNKIKSSMEKLRWLPHTLGDRYGLINLATTWFRIIEKDVPVLSMKVINGRANRRTPTMIDLMKRIELNPTWTVPLNLAIWDKLPHIQEDPSFLSRGRFEVLTGSNTPLTAEESEQLPWSTYSRSNFPVILRQRAGPGNVLGIVKFPLTNKYSIYLHDTDERNLFKKAAPRLISSGCVRLEKPMELASYLLKGQALDSSSPNINPDEVKSTESLLMDKINNNPEKTIGINVENPLPLYFIYLTADRNDKGEIRFENDNYNQDGRLLKILNNPGLGSPDIAEIPKNIKGVKVPFKVTGELGPTQLFGSVVATRCEVWPYKGCVFKNSKGKEYREEFHFNINETVNLPEGYYILGAENSMFPGWVEVQCQSVKDSKICKPIEIKMTKVFIPEDYSQAEELFIYRDLSTFVEQNKILSQGYHNGRALIQETLVTAKNFYLPGVNQFDYVQRLNTDYCSQVLEGRSSQVAPEVRQYCESLEKVMGMADYTELPVVMQSYEKVGTTNSSSGKSVNVMEFPLNNEQSLKGHQWSQRWVDAPGNWINFIHRRYLIGVPMFPKNIPPEKRFISVLPGKYRILEVDASGNAVKDLSFKTENIHENYEEIARKVILGR